MLFIYCGIPMKPWFVSAHSIYLIARVNEGFGIFPRGLEDLYPFSITKTTVLCSKRLDCTDWVSFPYDFAGYAVSLQISNFLVIKPVSSLRKKKSFSNSKRSPVLWPSTKSQNGPQHQLTWTLGPPPDTLEM